MKRYLALMSKKKKIKCCGVVLFAFATAVFALIWLVRMGELYTAISNGTIRTIAQKIAAVVAFDLIYLSTECIVIIRREALDCIIAFHGFEVRGLNIDKLLTMPISCYLVITFIFGIEGKAEYLIQERNRINFNVIVIIVCFQFFNAF